MNSALEWHFGGWSPAAGWSLLVFVALAGMGLITWLYRQTLRNLSPRQRLLLAALRSAILLTLLLCLANPSRVERSRRPTAPPRTLAVLVDRSGSMSTPDNRAGTRLASALQIWKQHTAEAGEAFTKIEHHSFSDTLQPAGSLEETTVSKNAADSTHFYEALQEALKTLPSSIVCLTDGLDTTGENAAALLEEAQRLSIPLNFVVGQNRGKPRAALAIREIHTPSRVLRQSEFTPGAVVEITAARDGTVPLELWSGDRKLAETLLPVRLGMNTLPWSPKISVGEPGPMPLEFRLGSGDKQEIASATTRIVPSVTLEVLYYQGALQWGYPFLVSALRSDPGFRLTSILNPSLGVKLSTAPTGAATLVDLPDNVAAFHKFNIVILAHVFADQLSATQQKVLVDYTSGGGAVLFITPDTESANRFSGTPLEQMLPVVFNRSQPKNEQDLAIEAFQRKMEALGGANHTQDTLFARDSRARQEPTTPLRPFAVAAGASRTAVGSLFERGGEGMPMFTDFASVQRAKPGAEILATYTPQGSSAAPSVLLARQNFGSGMTATLATDLLWRWKMSLPSTSHAVEKFWQQLILSLAPSPGQGLRLLKTSGPATANSPIMLKVEGAETLPTLMQKMTGEKTFRPVALREIEGGSGRAWEATFTAVTEGRSEFVASDAGGNQARITVPITSPAQNLENSNLPPDIEGLRKLAEATGGTLIGDEPAFRESESATENLPELKRVRPLWNTSWLLGLLLAFYGVELITRRRLKLL